MSDNEITPMTVLVWNEAKIIVTHVNDDAEAQVALAHIQRQLHHKSDDPRWQILSRWATVQVQP